MKIAKLVLFSVAFGFAQNSLAEESVDVFGFTKFYKSVDRTLSWDSRHWANGKARTLGWDGDPDDPYGWTEPHFSCPNGECFKVDGKGVMQMLGDGPRFHVNSLKGAFRQFYLNTEYTAYFKRNALGGKDYGGIVVGVRSDPLGHASSGGDDCNASTYYGRFRNDGKWDLEKEWKHPGSHYQSEGVMGKQTPMWGGQLLPVDKWIGMKYIVYNKDISTVHLELYVDSTSGGVPPGKWEKVGEADDSGLDWSGASGGASTISGCSYTDAFAAILEGHGTILMRSDNDQPYYKFVSVREIDPKASFESEILSSSSEAAVGSSETVAGDVSSSSVLPLSSSENSTAIAVTNSRNVTLAVSGKRINIGVDRNADMAVFDMQGRVISARHGFVGNLSVSLKNSGLYIVKVGGFSQIIRVP